MASLSEPQIPKLKTIEAALKLVDIKKESLKKAYDDLQLQSRSLLLPSFSLSLSWPDIDAHFSTLQTTLTRRFHQLQSLDTSPPTSQEQVDSAPTRNELGPPIRSHDVLGNDPSSSSNPPGHNRVDSDVTRHDPASSSAQGGGGRVDTFRADVMALCEKMDGKGLRDYMNDNPNKRGNVLAELQGAMRVAADPGAMVLDALGGFYSADANSKGDKDPKLCRSRRTCIDMLEALVKTKPNLSDEVIARAKKLALEWKGKASLDGESPLEALGFLQLVVAYRLENEFDKGELVDFFFVVAKFNQAVALCRAIGLGERTSDLIQKLIDNGKYFSALKFIFEFGLTDKFQPIPLLSAHLQESKRSTEEVCKDTNNSIKIQNDARTREVNALKLVLKIINDHKLGSQYPRVDIEKRIEMLEKQKADNKQPAPVSNNKPQKQENQQPKKQQQRGKKRGKKQRQVGNRRPRTIVANGPAVPIISASGSRISQFQQPANLLPAAGMYGFADSTAAAANHAGSSAGLYGLPAVGFPGTPGFPGVHLGFTEPQMPSAYGGYGLPPQYHQTYYPQ